ncbi:hypothetical protein F7Q91_02950 [Vibrio chagasii]|uniref:Uncharacterized protein n=1 Tax=Vibrio chagasii TaxID=170679 RepID=A0A7V7NWW5_9VIBR|nr:hypothetical protein [Vibrio chagasii]KAB0482379.1 hypothetical protein F7Q91_02950 [Vibrio chagasii]
MSGIRIKSKENGASLSLDFTTDRADNAPQTGVLIFAGNADSNKHILAQATFEQFKTPSILYGLLSGDVMASECLEASAHKLCVATIHAESESDVLESLSRLGLSEHISDIKAVFYCDEDSQTLDCRKLNLN